MFFVEASVFCIFLVGFAIWLLLSDRLVEWRSRRETDRISRFVDDLAGTSIQEAIGRFGPPVEQFTSSTGRGLYVWHGPPSRGLPHISGVLIVTLTTDENGFIVESNWQRR